SADRLMLTNLMATGLDGCCTERGRVTLVKAAQFVPSDRSDPEDDERADDEVAQQLEIDGELRGG
ncbi:MAG TPA: hypothetical protein VLL25_03670, partial [Acidimicrobiales bacterium]|nr:hypothetical protein [Acidimicrobiales bacterium]